MIFAFLAFIAIAIGIFYVVTRGATESKRFLVDVIEVIDGRTIEVKLQGSKLKVVLAGIGYPPGDEKALCDALDFLKDVVVGKRLYMEVLKEVQGLMYVAFKSANDDCLNEMVLNRGLARYESTGIGFVSALIAAENQARSKGIGIWDKNRELFKHMTGRGQETDFLDDGNSIDSYDGPSEEYTANPADRN